MRLTSFSEQQAWLLLRCLLALFVSVHGWSRWFADGVLPFARGMDAELPLGFYLVCILQGMEMFGSLVLAAGRFVSVLSAVFAIIYSCSIYFYHSYFGWFSSGGKQDGAEYAVALIACFLCVAWRYLPRQIFSIKQHWQSAFEGDSYLFSSRYSNGPWLVLRWMLLGLIGSHIVYRLVHWSVADMVRLMPEYVLAPQALAWSVTVIQALALLAIVAGVYRVVAYRTLACFYVAAIAFYHAWQGWKVSGTKHNGVEYVLLLTVVLLLSSVYEQRLRSRAASASEDVNSVDGRLNAEMM